MKIVVFSPDVPYPPNRGGRADIWRRIEAFIRLGHQVMLVHIHEPAGVLAPRPEHFASMDAILACRFSFPIRRSPFRTLKQLAFSLVTPWHAATRIPQPDEFSKLEEMFEAFAPDWLWLDGPWFGVVATRLAGRSGVPMLYRSHNIEHLYMRRQSRAAVRWRDRIAWRLTCIGLERFEFHLMQQALRVFDISVDDLAYWRARGGGRASWLPPLPELALKAPPSDTQPFDIVFVGNLGTPNNVRGVQWLLQEILPLIREARKSFTCAIVGSNPTRFIRGLIEASESVVLRENVPDVLPYLFGARVLVNPVKSGSGVQVKMLDMLMTDAPIVTARQGVRGLPESIQALVSVEDDAQGFAAAVLREMEAPTVDRDARERGRHLFSVEAIQQALLSAVREEGGAC